MARVKDKYLGLYNTAELAAAARAAYMASLSCNIAAINPEPGQ